MANKYRVCVVGAGSIGREFALNHFNETTSTTVTVIVDRDEAKAATLAADVGAVQAGASVDTNMPDGRMYRSKPDTMIGDPVPSFGELGKQALDLCDIVYVGVTPNAHKPLVLMSLQSGKHVLLEKPLAATAQDADDIVNAAEDAKKRGIITSMNIGMRWNEALHHMREIAIVKHELGNLKSAELRLGFITWPRQWQVQEWCAQRAQGGALREVGTHFFFGINELFGHECVSRCCCSMTWGDGEDGVEAETAADGILVLKDGLEIHLSLKLGLERDLYELEVVGEHDSLMLESFKQLKKPGQEKPLISASYGRKECIHALVREINGEIAHDIITPRQGRNAQRVLDALLSSRGKWQEVVYD